MVVKYNGISLRISQLWHTITNGIHWDFKCVRIICMPRDRDRDGDEDKEENNLPNAKSDLHKSP